MRNKTLSPPQGPKQAKSADPPKQMPTNEPVEVVEGPSEIWEDKIVTMQKRKKELTIAKIYGIQNPHTRPIHKLKLKFKVLN